MPDLQCIRHGHVRSIDNRGRIALEVDGRLVFGQMLDGGGGWIGDPLVGDIRPGLRTWRHPRNGMLVHVQVLLAEVESVAPTDAAWCDSRAA
ncbi:MAG: hypothetical protein HOQ02_02355 [Lysobacter sp.]|nr:hypothetical protein [Lysobacter sp.]